MRASWLVGILFILSAPVVAEDFYVTDNALTALPPFEEGVVRAHWTFVGYEDCQVVGKAINLAESGEEKGYFATTADDCAWLGGSGPIWVVKRVNGALHLVLSDHGFSSTVAPQSRNGLRHISISAILTGWYFESQWEFNGTVYVKTGERKEDMR
jgi:hypothetical protein